jgi:hypothetical protein
MSEGVQRLVRSRASSVSSSSLSTMIGSNTDARAVRAGKYDQQRRQSSSDDGAGGVVRASMAYDERPLTARSWSDVLQRLRTAARRALIGNGRVRALFDRPRTDSTMTVCKHATIDGTPCSTADGVYGSRAARRARCYRRAHVCVRADCRRPLRQLGLTTMSRFH